MTDPLSKAKTALDLDEIEKAAKATTASAVESEAEDLGIFQATVYISRRTDLDRLLDPETVLALVSRARRADELEKRVAELEARVEYLS